MTTTGLRPTVHACGATTRRRTRQAPGGESRADIHRVARDTVRALAEAMASSEDTATPCRCPEGFAPHDRTHDDSAARASAAFTEQHQVGHTVLLYGSSLPRGIDYSEKGQAYGKRPK
jgi:hypothetical protein